ncbi:MAG: hypothetical protein NT092_12465 [Bacteroidia bacterium]|nr:hypothetical protein [Bacteroidia bacterium]
MKAKIHSYNGFFTIIIIVLFLFPIPLMSQDNAIKLVYNYPGGTPVRYINTSKVKQDMNIDGQSMVVNVLKILGTTVKSSGIDDKNLVLEITIDTLAQTVDTPGGLTGGAIKDVLGKSFSMKINPQGKEIDISGAEKITFTTDDGTTSSAAQSFNDFFPDLPEDAIIPGYIWSSTDTVRNKTSVMKQVTVVKSENKFEGFEQLNDTKCAKITYLLSGSWEIKTQSQGMELNIKGPFTGSGVLYFSPEKGYFLKNDIKTRMTGNMEIAEQNVSIPIIMDMSSTTEVR